MCHVHDPAHDLFLFPVYFYETISNITLTTAVIQNFVM